jgi:LysM repeat protein
MRHFGSAFSFFFLFSVSLFAQPSEKTVTPEEYIWRFKDHALKEMYQYGIPASITLAQAMLESGNGNSPLAMYANNHFGIKCHEEWDGLTYMFDDDVKNECFRKYSDPLESYSDHSLFLISRDRYTPLFELPKTNYKEWARGLQDAGYATSPTYATRLVEMIEQYNLFELDHIRQIAARKMKLQSKQKSQEVKQKTAVFKRSVPKQIPVKYNQLRYIIAKKGDTFYRISRGYDVDVDKIFKYNDLWKGEKLRANQKIFLEPKLRKAAEPYHLVANGETMKSISQLHGIKLKSLYRKNRMKTGTTPLPGTILYMRKRKPRHDELNMGVESVLLLKKNKIH